MKTHRRTPCELRFCEWFVDSEATEDTSRFKIVGWTVRFTTPGHICHYLQPFSQPRRCVHQFPCLHNVQVPIKRLKVSAIVLFAYYWHQQPLSRNEESDLPTGASFVRERHRSKGYTRNRLREGKPVSHWRQQGQILFNFSIDEDVERRWVECKNLTVRAPTEALTRPLQIWGRQTTDICASNIIGVQLLSSLQEQPKEVEVEAVISSSDRWRDFQGWTNRSLSWRGTTGERTNNTSLQAERQGEGRAERM